jgi:hypothetical protein
MRDINAKEKRIFKIEVGNIPDDDVKAYIEEIKNKFKQEPANYSFIFKSDNEESAWSKTDNPPSESGSYLGRLNTAHIEMVFYDQQTNTWAEMWGNIYKEGKIKEWCEIPK